MKIGTLLKIRLLLVTAFIAEFFISASVLGAAYLMPQNGDSVVGNMFTIVVQRGDTVTNIRSRYEVSYHELVEANPHINFSNLRAGDALIIPKQHVLPPYRKGIVINMAELRVYYFTSDGQYVFTFPVGMGRPDWRTPTTVTKIVKKTEDPTWFVPDSIQEYTWEKYNIWLPDVIPYGHPKNPLGKYALYLAKRGYLIHGTNQPESVGTFASSGCMRLNSESIQMLYEDVEIGTPVYIIHHANKVGWLDGQLYLESHVPVRLDEVPNILNTAEIDDAITQALMVQPKAHIDWNAVQIVSTAHDGVPHIIGKKTTGDNFAIQQMDVAK